MNRIQKKKLEVEMAEAIQRAIPEESTAFMKQLHGWFIKETERLMNEGYPLELAVKMAVGLHPNSDISKLDDE